MLTIGIDEVGRGCWAGPLVAAAVLLDPERPIAGLNDSKKLSKQDREQLDILIRGQALAYGIGWVWPEDIDISGITTSVKLAMSQACDEVLDKLRRSITPQIDSIRILIDGNYNYLPSYPNVAVLVGADGLNDSVSAASIIAKVARDKYMAGEASDKYPNYGFASHVGYGTAQHIAMLQQQGVTPIHRKSYKPIRALL